MTVASEHSAAAIRRTVGGGSLVRCLAMAASAQNDSTAFLSRIKRIPKLVGVGVNCRVAGAA